ncbi:protein far1-related sequence 11-like isoform x2 [Gigaspora margarita]|uniref:Protein far1-related sequence 11-like isoform x2 n=1 Tax=Gigaspora margarita TaxID=4874 RepID=A0A8H4ESK0_GIGMA|nr:protein far1-related sequence 11-like isoform x2 [Gigaspora margarita]
MNYEVREDVSSMLTAISPIQPKKDQSMNYEVREDVSSMLTAISPIQPTPIALPVEQDGSGHRETIIPLSPTTPQEDSAGFSGTAGGLSDNGTFVTPQAPNSSVILAVGGSDLKGLDNDAAKLWIWELARRATQIAVDQQDNSLEELLRRYIREKEDRIGRQTSQTTQQ